MTSSSEEPGLFVYGTLHPDRAPDEIREAVAQLRLIGPATIPGRVHDLGEYPALLSGAHRGIVMGTLFALPHDSSVLKALDEYEGYDPKQPERSLFLRRKRVVTLSDGRKERHWVYVYNRELPAAS